MHNSLLLNRLQKLLSESLVLWDIKDAVLLNTLDGHIQLNLADGSFMKIKQTDACLKGIARWSITRQDGSSRLCSSVLGVLSTVRDTLSTTQSSALPLRVGVMGVSV